MTIISKIKKTIKETFNMNSNSNSNIPVPLPVQVEGDERYFYNADDVKSFSKMYFFGVLTGTVRKIIAKKNIPDSEYLYALQSKDGSLWKKQDASKKLSNQSKLLISKDWLNADMIRHSLPPIEAPEILSLSTEKNTTIYVTGRKATEQLSTMCVPAPDIFHLDDTEKFRDYQGNVIDIETRGEKTRLGIYFSTTDITNKFYMPDLINKIRKENSGYEVNRHYKEFVVIAKNPLKIIDHFNEDNAIENSDNNTVESSAVMVKKANCLFDHNGEDNAIEFPHNNTVESLVATPENPLRVFEGSNDNNVIEFPHNNTVESLTEPPEKVNYLSVGFNENTNHGLKKEYFLTYKGLFRYFAHSRSPNADYFQDWAEEKLFTHQMGTPEAKINLAIDLVKPSINNFLALNKNTCLNGISCIYLLELGTVGDLRETFNICCTKPDNYIVYKYGRTENLIQRVKEHKNDYGKLINKEILIEAYCLIDDCHTTEAENGVRQLLSGMDLTLNIEGRNELVAIPMDKIGLIKSSYMTLGKAYGGKSSISSDEIRNLRHEIEGFVKDAANHVKEIARYERDAEKEYERREKELVRRDDEERKKEENHREIIDTHKNNMNLQNEINALRIEKKDALIREYELKKSKIQ
jgi:hypothetical protein